MSDAPGPEPTRPNKLKRVVLFLDSRRVPRTLGYLLLFIICFAGVVALWVAFGLFHVLSFSDAAGGDTSPAGTFGDSFGMVNSLFSGLAFAALVIAIFLQLIDLRKQQKEIDIAQEQIRIIQQDQKDTREAVEKQIKVLEEQTKLIVRSSYLAALNAIVEAAGREEGFANNPTAVWDARFDRYVATGKIQLIIAEHEHEPMTNEERNLLLAVEVSGRMKRQWLSELVRLINDWESTVDPSRQTKYPISSDGFIQTLENLILRLHGLDLELVPDCQIRSELDKVGKPLAQGTLDLLKALPHGTVDQHAFSNLIIGVRAAIAKIKSESLYRGSLAARLEPTFKRIGRLLDPNAD